MSWGCINQKKDCLYSSALLHPFLNEIVMWLPCFPSVNTNGRVGQLTSETLIFFLSQKLKEGRRVKTLYAVDNIFCLWLTILVLSSGDLDSYFLQVPSCFHDCVFPTLQNQGCLLFSLLYSISVFSSLLNYNDWLSHPLTISPSTRDLEFSVKSSLLNVLRISFIQSITRQRQKHF